MTARTMIDPAILHITDAPLPPWRPTIVHERVLLSQQEERAKQTADEVLAAFRSRVSSWSEQMETIRTGLSEFGAEGRRYLSLEEHELVSEMIERIEQAAADRAHQAIASHKRMHREIKRHLKSSPQLSYIGRKLADALKQADRAVVDELAEHALWLRAFRAEHIADAKGGPVFSDPDAMGDYLRRALA